MDSRNRKSLTQRQQRQQRRARLEEAGANAIALAWPTHGKLLVRSLAGTARKTPSWFDYGTLNLGKVGLKQPGTVELTVRAKDPTRWKAMNIREIRLAKAE